MYPFFLNVLPKIQEVVLYFVLVVYIFKNFNIIYKLFIKNKKMFNAVLIVCLVHILSFLIPILHGTNDFSLAYRMFSLYKSLVKFLTLIIYTYKYSYENREKRFMVAFINATCLYVSCSLFLIFIPYMKDVWRIICFNKNLMQTYTPEYQLRYGLCGYSGFDFTCMCTMGFVFLTYCYLKKYQKERQYFIKSGILLVGNILYARVGVLTTLILMIIFLIYMLFVKKKFGILMKYVLIMSVVFIIFALLVSKIPQLSKSVELLLEFAIRYKQTNEIASASTDVLQSMYYTPDIKTLVIGDGRYFDFENNRNYLSSDVGIIRYLFFGGLLFEILFYIIPVQLIFRLKGNKDSKIIIAMMLFMLLIMEMKGEMFIYFGGIYFAMAAFRRC